MLICYLNLHNFCLRALEWIFYSQALAPSDGVGRKPPCKQASATQLAQWRLNTHLIYQVSRLPGCSALSDGVCSKRSCQHASESQVLNGTIITRALTLRHYLRYLAISSHTNCHRYLQQTSTRLTHGVIKLRFHWQGFWTNGYFSIC